MSDRFFTFMIVPERSDRIRKISLPTWLLRAAVFLLAALALMALLFFFDYLHMLSQVAENKRLRVENHLIKMEIQSAKNKVEALDQSVSRLKSFAHKLRVISNLDQPETQRILQAPPEGLKVGGAPAAADEEGGSIDDDGDGGAGAAPAPAKGKPRGKRAPKAAPPATSEGAAIAPPDRDSDLHSRLEYQRSRSVLGGEFTTDFDAQTLTQQVSLVSDAAVRLREVAEIEEQSFAELQEHLQDRVSRLLSTPSLLPAQGYISSEFGHRYNPFSGVRTFHAGLDIANHIGTPIYAPADGRVTKVGLSGGFGTVVRIDHGYGIVTKYGHTSKVFVHPGDRVRRGEKIAEVGNSGRSTGPHCHYQVEVNNRPVQPRLFILDEMF